MVIVQAVSREPEGKWNGGLHGQTQGNHSAFAGTSEMRPGQEQ